MEPTQNGPDLIPSNDVERLQALHKYKVLYTDPEETFDNITKMMAEVFQMPMTFVSLVDKELVFYKSKVGPFPFPSVNRPDSLCSIAVLHSEPTIFHNTMEVPYLTEGKYVKAEGGIRFYAGAPLTTPEGYRIGTVCLVDTVPREFTPEQANLLKRFAATVQHIIEMRSAARAQSEELEHLVAERTHELQQVNRQLQHSNAELEQFAYVSSHDLQEPLRKISIFAHMVQEAEGHNWSEATRGYFSRIIDAAQRMSTSLKDLLKYASLSNESPAFERVDLNDVLQGVLTDLELLIHQKGARIESDSLPVISAIPLQMQQLFYNLINNGLKFHRDGVTPHISIRVNRINNHELWPETGSNSDRYEICFSDNGIGFAPAYSEKIFGMFQRLHTRDTYGGNGIGLALCRKVASNHGGAIQAYSNLDEGATFKVILPATQELKKVKAQKAGAIA